MFLSADLKLRPAKAPPARDPTLRANRLLEVGFRRRIRRVALFFRRFLAIVVPFVAAVVLAGFLVAFRLTVVLFFVARFLVVFLFFVARRFVFLRLDGLSRRISFILLFLPL
jgi:hypothetical protein